ncbi:hypothetical protein HMPREF2955_01605 [Prevotella sp. HMSC073D09]|nr:hypothetical protein HMPREF2955_01605 [Prevotella sp. HMSC073D09]
MPLERYFQLAKHVLKVLPPGHLFEASPRFATDKCSRISEFIVSLSNTSYMGGVLILVLHHKYNKLLSIDRKIKSKDYAINFVVCFQPDSELKTRTR